MSYLFEDHQGVLRFTINRPHKHNAINGEVMKGLKEAIFYARNTATSKMFVITGAGEKSFCSGGDLSEFHSLRTEQEAHEMLSEMGSILYDLATLPMPTIALVNGTAVGGGCEIATACDFRLMKNTAKAGFIQGSLAIITGWGGSTYLFERGLKQDDALKMLLEAKPYPADYLKFNGWATELYEDDHELALERFIQNLLAVHPSVHQTYKKVLLAKWNETNVHQRVLNEIRQCAILWEQDAHHEAVARFLNKSK